MPFHVSSVKSTVARYVTSLSIFLGRGSGSDTDPMVYKECRYVPRGRTLPGWNAYPKPYFDPGYESYTIVCYCEDCDKKFEAELPRFLEEFCNCDQYRRLICLPCRKMEIKEDNDYRATRSKSTHDGYPYSEDDQGCWLGVTQSWRAVSIFYVST
jgi:hypothetical protein